MHFFVCFVSINAITLDRIRYCAEIIKYYYFQIKKYLYKWMNKNCVKHSETFLQCIFLFIYCEITAFALDRIRCWTEMIKLYYFQADKLIYELIIIVETLINLWMSLIRSSVINYQAIFVMQFFIYCKITGLTLDIIRNWAEIIQYYYFQVNKLVYKLIKITVNTLRHFWNAFFFF